MQRLAYFYTGTSRIIQIVGSNHLKNSKFLYEQKNALYNTHNLLLKRCLSTKNKDSKNTNNVNIHADLYKPSTAKKETHVSDDLKGGQSVETIERGAKNSSIGDGKVWSAQNPGSIHVAPLGRVAATNFVPKSTEGDDKAHETTVYTTQGEVNIADPFTTHKLQPEATPAQLAESAAASAFEPFAPDTPLKSTSTAEPVFAPKISSTEVYSTTSSPTAHFDTSVPPSSSQQETVKYETTNKPKVFGGQDTSAETKKRPKQNPFDLKDKPSNDSKKISNQDEKHIRDEILRVSLNYVHEKGWSMETICAGINACNQPAITQKLFYNGYDLVEYFMRDANTKMVTYMDELVHKENIQGTRLLIDGLKYRLKLVIPYADTWEQALAQKGLPPNAKRAWKSLLDLANDALLSIGDTSTDIKWYTKRLTVATIYRSAEIYMLQDQSLDKTETMSFLERHLGDFQTTGIIRPSVTQSLSDTAQVASGLFTVVRTMTTRR